MSIQILMPALSPTMEEGKLTKWLKQEGEDVKAGDILAEIETDKATMEVEATDEGTLGKILVPAGQAMVKVNTPIAILLEEGEDASAIAEIEAQTPPPCQADSSLKKAPAAPIASPKAASAAVEKDLVLQEEHYQGETKFMTVREALNAAHEEEMRRDERVFLIGEEVGEYQGAYKVSQNLLQKFGPKRVVDTPITEHGFTGLGVGAAYAGLRPIVEFMTYNFAMQAIDQIINSAAKARYMSGGQLSVPIVFRGPNGAASRVAAQHSQCYAAWYGQIPGLKVVMPYSAADAKGLLKSAIRDDNPVVILENELLYGHKFEVPTSEDWLVPIGKARLHKLGKDVTIVGCGMGMHYVIQAAETLATMGIDAEIIDLRSVRPLDYDTIIASVQKTGRLITVEEGFPQSSLGTEIATRVMQRAFDYLDAPIQTIAGKDVPMPYAANLEKLALPSVDEIITAAKLVTYSV